VILGVLDGVGGRRGVLRLVPLRFGSDDEVMKIHGYGAWLAPGT
jgi:hypothetical protein